MLSYLIIIASIVLTANAINTATTATTTVLRLINNKRKLRQLTNSHPELRGVELNNLLVFAADDETRSAVITNEEEGDNIPMMSKVYGDWDSSCWPQDDLFDEDE